MKELIRPRTAAGLVVGAALALAGAVGSDRSAVEGYVVTQRVSLPDEDPFVARVKVAQGRVRLEMQGGPLQAMPAGVFILMRDDAKVTVVMPSEGMAMQMDAAQLSGGIGGMMSAFGMSMPTVSDISVSVDDLGAGETMLGYATRKYRVRQSYTMTGGMMGGSQPARHQDVSEMWMATTVPGLSDGLQKFADTMGGMFGGAGPGASKELAVAMAGKMPKGYPLKTVTTSTITTGGTAGRPTTTTIEVLDITRSNIDATEFEVPAGIQVIDPAAMMRGRGGR